MFISVEISFTVSVFESTPVISEAVVFIGIVYYYSSTACTLSVDHISTEKLGLVYDLSMGTLADLNSLG